MKEIHVIPGGIPAQELVDRVAARYSKRHKRGAVGDPSAIIDLQYRGGPHG